jgi:site-specific DNA recombinase
LQFGSCKQIGQVYQDKLDGTIDKDFWNRKSSELTLEAQQIKDRIDRFEQTNTNYYEDGVRILELSQRAHSLS